LALKCPKLKILGLRQCVFLTLADVEAIVDAKVSASLVGDEVGVKHTLLERIDLVECAIEDHTASKKGEAMPDQLSRAQIVMHLRTKYRDDGVHFTYGTAPVEPRTAQQLYQASVWDQHRSALIAETGRTWVSPARPRAALNRPAPSNARRLQHRPRTRPSRNFATPRGPLSPTRPSVPCGDRRSPARRPVSSRSRPRT
jgi:hypothetical protein